MTDPPPTDRYRPDVRPHVPHVDPAADPRLHLIIDGVTACGVPATVSGRHGTHDPAEAGCPDCVAAGLPGEVADLVQLAADGAAHGDLTAAEELARAMHPAAFDEVPASAGNRPTDLRSGEDYPRGWDRVDGGGERVVHPAPPRDWDRIDAVNAVIRSLGGHLTDMTAAVVAYADENHLRRWQCRHCALGRVMGPYAAVTVREERAEAADHEAHCDRNPNRDPGAITEEATRA